MSDDKKSRSIIRTGPKPLMTHLGLTLSAKMQQSGSDCGSENFSDFLQGIKKYQLYPYERPRPIYDVVWQGAGAKLFKIPSSKAADNVPALFIVPSMVNRYTIMDLLPEQSFCRWVADQGRDVYLLDWGDMRSEKDAQGMDDVFAKILIPSAQHIAELTEQKLHFLGYCMGGTLAAALAALRADLTASLTLVATPWDFQSGDGDLEKWVRFWAPTGLGMITQMGYLPANWMQTVFASLDPFQMERKFAAFANYSEDGKRAEVFVCVEDWLNGAVDLPGPLAHECIQGWFLDNQPVKGRWRVLGEYIMAKNIKSPVCIVASKKDRLVPYNASMALDATSTYHVQAACGHIAYMASKKSKLDVWPLISDFIKAYDSAA